MSTFVSLDEVLQAFWIWLETAEVMLMSLWQRIAVSKVIWQCVEVGELVYSPDLGWVEVLDKDLTFSKSVPRFWVAVGDRIETIMPYQIEARS